MKSSYTSFKQIFFTITFLLLICSCANAQNTKKDFTKKIPKVVLEGFKKAYPNAIIKDAGKEIEKGKTLYEIESIDGSTRRDLLMRPDGTITEIEEQIAEKELPADISKSIYKEFPNGKISKAEKLTKDGSESYEVVLKTGNKSVEVVLDKDGKILKKENLK